MSTYRPITGFKLDEDRKRDGNAAEARGAHDE
jgi:hypothetical protein